MILLIQCRATEILINISTIMEDVIYRYVIIVVRKTIRIQFTCYSVYFSQPDMIPQRFRYVKRATKSLQLIVCFRKPSCLILLGEFQFATP